MRNQSPLRPKSRRDEPLTVARLAEVFDYDQASGALLHKKSMGRFHTAGDVAGHRTKSGYIRVCVDQKNLFAHRVAYAIATGEFPVGPIDHMNGDRSDNRLCNLRVASPRINMENQRKARSDSKSGILGVVYDPAHNRWRAGIGVRGKKVCLGSFKSPEAASRAYLDAKRSLHEGSTL